MTDEEQHDDERGEREVVVVAVEVREVERSELSSGKLHGDRPLGAGEERSRKDVGLRSNRERHRADREEKALHTQGTHADRDRDEAGDERTEEQRGDERNLWQLTPDEPRRSPADVERDAAHESRGTECTDSCERHLSQ